MEGVLIIDRKLGNVGDIQSSGKPIDWLKLEWHEANKRILRKHTDTGKEIALKFLTSSPQFTQGDILFEDEHSMIVVEISKCDVIVVKPSGMYEMAAVCYEVGNRHLPLFFAADEIMMPFDLPLFNLLTVWGYKATKECRQLLNPIKTTIAPHNISMGPGVEYAKQSRLNGE